MSSSIRELFLTIGPFLLRSFVIKQLQSTSILSGRPGLRRCQRNPQCLFNNFLSTQKSDDNIKIIPAKAKDEGRLTQFLRDHYYPEEPLSIGAPPFEPDPAEEEYNMTFIEYGTCLLAWQPCQPTDGEKEMIVGAVIAGPKDRGEADRIAEEAERLGSSKYGKVLKLVGCIERKTNVYDTYCVDRVLHVHILAVGAQTRCRKVGARLMKEVIKLASELGYEMVTADCSSIYSARLCQRIGMKSIHLMRYSEYKDECGLPVFSPPLPHKTIETFAQLLKQPK